MVVAAGGSSLDPLVCSLFRGLLAARDQFEAGAVSAGVPADVARRYAVEECDLAFAVSLWPTRQRFAAYVRNANAGVAGSGLSLTRAVAEAGPAVFSLMPDLLAGLVIVPAGLPEWAVVPSVEG
jgi:hypothetical protein